ncbi:MAG TPA: DUF6544 family protein [Puia sp.]|jgi:hypothetical protein|nr:DUF6544 family protein [Puia sp.]
MDILLILIAVALSEAVILKVRSIVRFGRDVNKLFSLSKDISEKTFQYGQLAGLPEPVQRYFRHVLKEGQPYISYVRLFHKGRFRTSLKSGWRNIEGEEYFTTENPGMIWKGRTTSFTAIDKYAGGKGQLKVFFLSLFRILKREGPVYDKSEMMRWLAESVWFPTNLLPDERLQWEPIDAHHALLCFQHANLQLFFKVSFNDKGEIVEFETKRYMDPLRQETWFGRVGSYQQHNGILIPGMIRALWRLKECDFCYAEFEVSRVEYNNPEGTDKYFVEERPAREGSAELVLHNSI